LKIHTCRVKYLKNRRLRQLRCLKQWFSFTHAFYRQARTDLEEIDPDPWTRSPLRSGVGEFKNDLDDLTLRLEMDKIVPYLGEMNFSSAIQQTLIGYP